MKVSEAIEVSTIIVREPRKQVGEFVGSGRPFYRDKNCWVPTDLQADIILFSKRFYKWESDEEYDACIQAIFKKYYLMHSEKHGISQSVIYDNFKDTLRTATKQPYYEGNDFEVLQERIEEEVFFKTFWDKKKEFSKKEIVDQLILRYVSELMQLSAFYHYGEYFHSEGAEWVMSVDLPMPDEKTWPVTEYNENKIFYA